MRAYVIDWLDHYEDATASAWNSIEAIKSAPVRVRTVAWVVKETPEIVTVSHTVHGGEAVGLFHILRPCIVQMVPLTLPKFQKGKANQ